MRPTLWPRLVLCFAVAALAPSAVAAATITLSLEGAIEFVDSQISSGFTVGAPMSLSLQIDSATPDTDADPTEGQYVGAVSNLTFTFGSYSATGGAENELHMRDGSGFSADNFFVSSDVSGADVAGFPVFDLLINLADTSLAVFSDDSIPASLDLADFDIHDVLLGFVDGNFVYRAHASITSLSYSVPEPGALALLALVAAGIALRRRA